MEPSETAGHGRRPASQGRPAGTEDAVLILSRKTDQSILIPVHGIEVRVLEIRGSRVQLGIVAPRGTDIIREEIAERYGYQTCWAETPAESDGRAEDREAAGDPPAAGDGGRDADRQGEAGG